MSCQCHFIGAGDFVFGKQFDGYVRNTQCIKGYKGDIKACLRLVRDKAMQAL